MPERSPRERRKMGRDRETPRFCAAGHADHLQIDVASVVVVLVVFVVVVRISREVGLCLHSAGMVWDTDTHVVYVVHDR